MTQKRRRIVIAGGVLAIIGGLFYAALPATWHYRLFHDEASLLQILSATEPGTSLGELENQLGPFDHVPEEHRNRLKSSYERMADERPEALPDGVTDRDEFIRLRMDGSEMNLQVRDERLVNFDPHDFDIPSEPIRVLNSVD